VQEEEILKAGISAARSGDRTRAASLFAQVVKLNPSSEQGWFYLGMCRSAPDEREYCFRRVLALNPNHLDAKRELVSLSKTASVQSPAWASQPRPVEPKAVSKPYTPVPSSNSPFVFDEQTTTAEEHIKPVTQVDQAGPEIEKPESPSAQGKKSNTRLILSLLLIPTLMACGFVAAYFIFPGQLTAWMSPILPEKQAQVPLITRTPLSPVAMASSTPVPSTAIPSPMPTVIYTPAFEQATCPFDEPPGSNVNCGYLIVPEDRTGDPSHTIQLAVAVYHSKSENPDPYPVIFLQGGPGAGAVQLAADAYDYLVDPFLSTRDFIVFDQRGTGLSEANLECDELKKLYLQDIHGLIPATTRKLVYSNAFLSCSGLINASGVNLNAYTTVESAADLKDILTVLGYQKVNLYGASYGTRLALVVMRDYPEIVQTAILDSVVPVESNLFNKYPDSIESGLKALFDSCLADAECHAAYPDLEKVFWELVNELDANPVTVTTSNYPTGTITETMTGSTAMSVILGSIKSTAFIDTAPQSIYRFRNGDYSTLIAAQFSLPYAFEDISPGLYISMMCHEQILATSKEELDAISNRRGVNDYAWLPFYGNSDDLFRACQSWGSTGPVLGENDAVISDIPSLVITGKFDPTTPPIFAQQVASHLSHSYYFEFPNQGHAPTAADDSGCAMDTVIAFLQDPSVEPDHDCLNDLASVDFIVPYTGDPPLALETSKVMGVTLDGPKDWLTLGDGFFFRGNSLVDITQIGIIQADLSADDLVDWFSLGAYGYRGLDTAPFKVGEREANGQNWSLYLSTSNGRPVDIAMADHGINSLVVMMFSNIDEHDALYRTVFLPMVDSAR
jgi:pimeloyl-ACP methyl ester carboxylesterase